MKLQTESTRIKQITITALAGSTVKDCLKEAIALSAIHEADIVLVHNENEYAVSFDRLNNTIKDPK